MRELRRRHTLQEFPVEMGVHTPSRLCPAAVTVVPVTRRAKSDLWNKERPFPLSRSLKAAATTTNESLRSPLDLLFKVPTTDNHRVA